jgi:hypothetical protein
MKRIEPLWSRCDTRLWRGPTFAPHLFHQPMSASYRIIKHAAGAFAVEVTEPGGVPFIAGWFKSEAAARAYIQEQERVVSRH